MTLYLNPAAPHRHKLTLPLADSQQAMAHDQITNYDDNKPEFTHELAAGGAAYFAMHEYEKHCAANGT